MYISEILKSPFSTSFSWFGHQHGKVNVGIFDRVSSVSIQEHPSLKSIAPCRLLAWTMTALPMPMLQRRLGHRRKREDDIFLALPIGMIVIKTTARNRPPQQSHPPCINTLKNHRHLTVTALLKQLSFHLLYCYRDNHHHIHHQYNPIHHRKCWCEVENIAKTVNEKYIFQDIFFDNSNNENNSFLKKIFSSSLFLHCSQGDLLNFRYRNHNYILTMIFSCSK